jgi:shikimate dehydrogenase
VSKNFAVIGDPIKHSLSPFIHNTLYEIYNLEATYHTLLIPKGRLQKDLPFLIKKYNLSGFNVTMPHKEAIIPLLTDISAAASLANSVNTVNCDNRGLHAHSTDAHGFIQALKANGKDPQNLATVFLGSGGAAAALALHWTVIEKSPLTIIARSIEKASAINEAISKQGGQKALILPWNKENICQALQKASLLVNTTPLGMAGNKEDFTDLEFLANLPHHALVFDLIYAPRQTALLQKARELGYVTINGLDMLIYQAMESFSIMTGIKTSAKDKIIIEKALAEQGLI